MCVSPKWLRNLVANLLGGIACAFIPKWRMDMATANVMECLGVDEVRARQIRPYDCGSNAFSPFEA